MQREQILGRKRIVKMFVHPVDGAVHRAAGSGLLHECKTLCNRIDLTTNTSLLIFSGRKLDGCEVGEAKITGGYVLPAWVPEQAPPWAYQHHVDHFLCSSTHIIHTVGSIYDEYRTEKEAAELLRSCYTNSLKLATEKELKSIVGHCFLHPSSARPEAQITNLYHSLPLLGILLHINWSVWVPHRGGHQGSYGRNAHVP